MPAANAVRALVPVPSLPPCLPASLPPCLPASLPPRLAPATPVSSPAASARRCSAAWSRRAGVDVERQREEGHEAGDDYLGRGKQSEGTRRRKWIALWREQRSVRMA